MTTSAYRERDSHYNEFSILIETGAQDFYRPNLERYQPPDFPRLSGTDQLISRLQCDRLLLIAGEPSMDPLSVTRYLAWFLSTQLRSSVPGIRVLEWGGSGGRLLNGAIERFLEPTIFILPQLQPQHIGHKLTRLITALGDRHFAIVALEELPLWLHAMGEATLDRYCEELRCGRVYTRRDLGQFLADRLRTHVPGALQRRARGGRIFVVSRPIEAVVDRLLNFVNIEEFVRLLQAEAKCQPLTGDAVDRCVHLATDDTAQLREWYFSLESTQARLLALALSLFDGLPESQFFAAVDLLIAQAWRPRDPTLCAIDYCDLDAVERFYRAPPSSEEGERIFKARLADQRQRLLNIVWKRHRRYVLSIVPVLSACVRESLSASADNLDLYGSPARRDQLRKTLSEVLGDIGALDPITTQGYLLQLAIDRHVGAQAVAAHAIARWRLSGDHQRAITLLRRWMDDDEVQRTIVRIRPRGEHEGVPPALSALKQTVALTVGYAAQSDPPNLIHPELLQLLERLSRDPDSGVQRALASYTIPMLLTQHLNQVEE
ncbi:MAG: hypothetical protein HGA45_41475, partial [Chloroflexales bacterium]|nr:hypothetical protein [Chloroflexales bacterium]